MILLQQQQQQQQQKKQNLSSKHSIYPNCPAPKTEKKHTSTSKQNLDPLLSVQLLLLLLQTTPQKKWVPPNLS
jgi:hypothetical protein